MEIVLLILLIVVLALLLGLFFKLTQRSDIFHLLSRNLEGMQQRMDTVNKELGTMQEIGRSMRDLQNFLRSPKLRGNISEQVLQDLLSQNFPQSFWQMQYKFKTGQIVDAVLKTDQGFIPIDAKFPLDNFKEDLLKEFFRDVKKHVQDVARKYILPEEGTVDFALIYVPSEAVFYEIIRAEEDLQQFAWQKKVLLTSPNTFFYFLKILLMGLQGKRIEEAAQRILMAIQTIDRDAKKFGETLNLINTHFTHARANLEKLNTQYSQLSTQIDQTKLLK